MTSILKIINKTLKTLETSNRSANPENFEKEFYLQLEQSDFVFQEEKEIKKLISNFSDIEKLKLNDSNQTFKDIANILSKRLSDQVIREFLKDFAYFMTSSIDKKIDVEIRKLCTKIAKKPNSLMDLDNLRDLRRLTDQRINADKKLFNDKTNDVKKLINFLGEYVNRFLIEHTSTIDEVTKLKNEIISLDLSESSLEDFKSFRDELLNSIKKFEHSIEDSRKSISNNQIKCDLLYEQIEELQENLNKAEEEKSIDYLTKVLTRRAYALEVQRLENEYKAFDSKYALIFYDIDHFKEVNDKYGHDCGDSVLSTFAQILKNLTRTGDIIARYGGEEFISLISYKNKLEVENYLKRVKNIISNNKFVYNDIKLNIEFCAGVTFRNNYSSY
ncbi:MAG: GGDEF domain-containing protein, partial [Sphaerochaetaceae bacterium]|nr:GGDEF domain-containing protein [Sphaerochaetaceae bacterium]